MSTDLMKFIAAIVMYVAWGTLAFLGKTDIGPFVGFTMAALGAILGHSSATVSRAVPASLDTKQVGRAHPVLLAIVATAIGLALLSMSGCTTTTASAYQGLYTQAKAGVMVFDDNALKTARDLLCAQPYSSIQRNSDMQAGIVTLCGPMANISSLDANQLQLLMNVMSASGVKLQSVPAAPAPAASSSK